MQLGPRDQKSRGHVEPEERQSFEHSIRGVLFLWVLDCGASLFLRPEIAA